MHFTIRFVCIAIHNCTSFVLQFTLAIPFVLQFAIAFLLYSICNKISFAMQFTIASLCVRFTLGLRILSAEDNVAIPSTRDCIVISFCKGYILSQKIALRSHLQKIALWSLFTKDCIVNHFYTRLLFDSSIKGWYREPLLQRIALQSPSTTDCIVRFPFTEYFIANFLYKGLHCDSLM